MRRAGYMLVEDPTATNMVREWDTFTCPHCNRVVRLEPFKGPPGWCLKHAKPLCRNCSGKSCVDFASAAQIEDRAARNRMLAEIGVVT